MGILDSITTTLAQQHGVSGSEANSLLAALLGLITDRGNGGFSGFLDRFRNAGLGDTVNSWIGTGGNTPLTGEEVEASLGTSTVDSLAERSGISRMAILPALAGLIPSLIDKLTPNGTVPSETSLLSTVGSYLTGGRPETTSAAPTVTDRIQHDRTDHDSGSSSVLRWLLPLLLLGLVLALGFWFCGRGTPVTNVNVNANRPAVNTNVNTRSNTNASTSAVDSSFRMIARDGKYAVTGVVPDQKTFDDIKARLETEFGAGNVDLSGLKVDAAARPFGPGWWSNFSTMLPSLKDWKNGSLAFTGNAVAEANGLPAAAMDQLKSLFSGWTLPAAQGSSANASKPLTEVSLPNGTILQAYPGGIEDQLVKFIGSADYKNAGDDQLKDKWFNFDDLNFVFGKTDLTPESKRQLDNIAAILRAFPDAKIKIGGYTDKKGDDAANLRLSDGRAKAVQAALQKAGVGAQVPQAEGYGEQFATVDENASDEQRLADRKTAVRLIK